MFTLLRRWPNDGQMFLYKDKVLVYSNLLYLWSTVVWRMTDHNYVRSSTDHNHSPDQLPFTHFWFSSGKVKHRINHGLIDLSALPSPSCVAILASGLSTSSSSETLQLPGSRLHESLKSLSANWHSAEKLKFRTRKIPLQSCYCRRRLLNCRHHSHQGQGECRLFVGISDGGSNVLQWAGASSRRLPGAHSSCVLWRSTGWLEGIGRVRSLWCFDSLQRGWFKCYQIQMWACHTSRSATSSWSHPTRKLDASSWTGDYFMDDRSVWTVRTSWDKNLQVFLSPSNHRLHPRKARMGCR
jgi:hypothetical protein